MLYLSSVRIVKILCISLRGSCPVFRRHTASVSLGFVQVFCISVRSGFTRDIVSHSSGERPHIVFVGGFQVKLRRCQFTHTHTETTSSVPKTSISFGNPCHDNKYNRPTGVIVGAERTTGFRTAWKACF